MTEIKSMALYHNDWIKQEVQDLRQDKVALQVTDLNKIDQLHYLGTEALDHTARTIDITEQTKVLDLGSGLGGPARYLAWKYGCAVTGVELQKELFDISIELTTETKLTEQVQFLNEDILTLDFQGTHDVFVSYLVFLHIRDREGLFQSCARSLKDEGLFYIEDFYEKQAFSIQEKGKLEQVMACPYLPTQEQYIDDLEKADFTEIQFEDVTDSWGNFVQERIQVYHQNRERNLRIHGEALTDHLGNFYQTVSNLFQGGNLGGVRVSGKKK